MNDLFFVFVYSNFCHFLFLDRRSCYACRKRCQCIPSPFRPTAISYELRLITFQSTRSVAKGRTNSAPCAPGCSVVLGARFGIQKCCQPMYEDCQHLWNKDKPFKIYILYKSLKRTLIYSPNILIFDHCVLVE